MPFSYQVIKTTKKTVPVPSLSKLSPSRSILNVIEVPNSFKRATTATGSVADKIEPIESA